MKRGMDAVIEKSQGAMSGKRMPMMRRKPGVAIMVAVEKPKMGPPRTAVTGQKDGEDEEGVCPECGYTHSKQERRGENLSKAQKVAALEEKIGYLKAELALLKDDEDAEEMDEEGGDEDEYEDEDED